MTEFAMSTNAIAYAQVRINGLWVRANTAAGDAFRGMGVGDTIVPLFEPDPYHGDAGEAEFEQLATMRGETADAVKAEYASLVGQTGAVPYLLAVTRPPRTHQRDGVDVIEIEIKAAPLSNVLAGGSFLRLRALDEAVAAQFKGSTPLLRVAEVTSGLAEAVRNATTTGRDEKELFRQYSLVDAVSNDDAASKLTAAGRSPLPGDRAFLVARTAIPGLAISSEPGVLALVGDPIAHPPDEVKDILIDAQRKATAADAFAPENAIRAVDQTIGMIQGGETVREIDDFREFYDFSILPRLVTTALSLQKRPMPTDETLDSTVPSTAQHSEDSSMVSANLAGLTVEAVLEELPRFFDIERSVIAAAVTALRSGKHLLLGGPPGSGKTTLAEALCRAVVKGNYRVATATEDWTTFDTIGGYLPDANNGLRFSPGVVLRSLRSAGWLIIDEINRADIDKAFGPLFTVLSGGEGDVGRTSVLPYSTEEGPIVIKWANSPEAGSSTYAITPSWRMIGTLNIADKASLFQLSFAFLRRFAVIDVPLPSADRYRDLIAHWLAPAGLADNTELLDGSMAAVLGPVPIGPAIGRDISEFVVQGIAPTASGAPAFESPTEAFAVAVRLFVVPQYEGRPKGDGEDLLKRLKDLAPSIESSAVEDLRSALLQVALT
jgi:MoxR-like ATPase